MLYRWRLASGLYLDFRLILHCLSQLACPSVHAHVLDHMADAGVGASIACRDRCHQQRVYNRERVPFKL